MEALYAEHRTTVLAVCRGLLRDHVEAEDAAQQTFLSAQRALTNGSVPRDPAAWLVTIARNECIARVRGRMREALPTADEPTGVGPDAHAAAVRREQVGHLRDALASLPAQQRDAILLRELRGLSYDEVAASLAVSTSAVESLLFRARRGLQLRLREVAASLSPVGWVGPLRDLGARLVGGGAAAPFAAKAVVVGLGTAVVAGGVVEAPRVIGLGHARHLSHATAPPAQHVSATPPLVFSAVGTGSGGSGGAPPGASGRDFTHMFALPGGHEGGDGSGQGGDHHARESEDSQLAPAAFTPGGDGSGGSTSHESRDGGGSSGGESGDGQATQGTQSSGDGQSSQTQQVSQSQDGQSDDGGAQGTQYGSVLTTTTTSQTTQTTESSAGTTTSAVTTTDGSGTGTATTGGDG